MYYSHLTVDETEAHGKAAYPDLVDVEWLTWDSNPDNLAIPWGSGLTNLGSRSLIQDAGMCIYTQNCLKAYSMSGGRGNQFLHLP